MTLESESRRTQTSTESAASAALADQVQSEPPANGQRTEYTLGRSDLGDLMPDAEEATIAAKIEALKKTVQELESWRERLHPGMDRQDFLSLVRLDELISEQMTILSGFGSLRFAANTQDAEALAYRNRIQQLIAQLANRTLFFDIWWKSLDDAEAEALLPSAEEQADYRHYLLEMRRFKPYTLDESSEKIINLKNANGSQAIVTMYSMLTSRLDFQLEVDGEMQTMTEDQMRSLFFSSDADIRARVSQEIFRVYERESAVLAQLYAYRVRDWQSDYVDLRGYNSPISVRNLGNEIPDEAVEVLLDVVQKNAPLFREFFVLKGKMLGMDKLRRYDLYAPLATSDKRYGYNEAVHMVLDTFRGFDDRLADMAQRVFDENHIDSEIRKGKRGGAFCSTLTPHKTPWVLVNFSGRLRDVTTLAHELGHAVHSMLADNHSILTQHPSLPLAETASVFAEMLLNDRMLAEESDPATRRTILSSMLDDIYATVMRQAYFVRFEIAAHQAVMDNVSADALFDLYYRHLEEQFADCMELSPEFRYEWISIPHMFRTPFYCYAYSFGQLLVLALYSRYREEGESFKPGYLRLLGIGGSQRPEEALREIGIEITDPAFWQGGFDIVRGMLEELKTLEAAS